MALVPGMDGVHVAWDRCAAALRARYTGKEGYPTICWNVHCTASKKIIWVAGPFEGATNDKTLVRYDAFSVKVRDDPEYTELKWPVLTGPGGEKSYIQGAWCLCDGGYHQWGSNMFGFKHNRTGDPEPWPCRAVERLDGIGEKEH